VNVLIVDDEPLPRKDLRRLLGQLPGVIVVGEAATADEAAAAIAREPPDVVLLDIEMPGGTGFDLLERVSAIPPVIFTTAYDQHAVRAFEVDAVDYLMKPIELDRLAAALARVGPRPERGIDRVFVRDGARCWLVPLREVRLIATDGNYVRLVWGTRELLLARSLAALERQLDPRMFVRANRAELVNLDFVVAVVSAVGARLSLQLRGGPAVSVSRRQARRFRALAP
jgi:two-component system LytT family response regulator